MNRDDFAQHTPLMRQYFAAKAEYPDTLVFFRMGDFTSCSTRRGKAARLLDITLTQRGASAGAPIPMAGVPYHAVESYPQLIRARRVGRDLRTDRRSGAARLANARSVVTPGTVTDEALSRSV
jgi:DNA mismatch repair protein MutS